MDEAEQKKLYRGCYKCPGASDELSIQPTFGPIPRIRVRCEVLNNLLVKTYAGKHHEDCDRRNHVMDKKCSPEYGEQQLVSALARA